MTTDSQRSHKDEHRFDAKTSATNTSSLENTLSNAPNGATYRIACPWCRGQGKHRLALHCGICRSRGLINSRSYTHTQVLI